jgi:multidrug efflux pump subunit AcrB
MRIWLRPDKVAQYNLTPGDIAGATREQNARFAAGRFGEEPNSESQAFTYSVTTPSHLAHPANSRASSCARTSPVARFASRTWRGATHRLLI